MSTLLKTGTTYGASIGHRTVFTREAAIERYKLFLEVCYKDHEFLMSESIALEQVENDLVRIGFTREELEQIENDYLDSIAE
jgi:hypothetical protein